MQKLRTRKKSINYAYFAEEKEFFFGSEIKNAQLRPQVQKHSTLRFVRRRAAGTGARY